MRRFFVLVLLALPASALAATYSVTDLGTLGGPSVSAHAINASGWVVGEALTASLQNHAFLYRDGAMIDLGVPGGMSVARAVSASGQIAGSFYDKKYSAFVTTGGKASDLGDLGVPYSVTYALNGAGHAAGSSYTEGRREHAFLWDGQRMVDLGDLRGGYSTARGINASDRVVGFAYVPGGAMHAFASSPSGLVDLGTLGGTHSAAVAINDLDQVVGFSCLEGNKKQHACLWTEGRVTDLGDLGVGYSEAAAIDPTGSRIVGKALVAAGDGRIGYHAFLWSGGSMRDLNDLIPAGSGWVLEEATGVNESGQITGSGTYQGQRRAFLLDAESPGASDAAAVPARLALSSPVPNPAQNSAHFSYALPRAGMVSIRVLDVSGRLVRDLTRGTEPAGTHDVTWDLADGAGRLVGSGVYYTRLDLDGESRTVSVQVLR